MLEIRPKIFPYHSGFSPHTSPEEFGFGATLYVKLPWKFISYIIYIFNTFYETLQWEKQALAEIIQCYCGGFLLAVVVFIGNCKMRLPDFTRLNQNIKMCLFHLNI